MTRVFNFSAGPASLPTSVLELAQAEMMDWHGKGLSVMEIGHRTLDFRQVAEQAEANLRALMGIPSHYHVLFLPGGASAQFAMVPLNLLSNREATADYIDTGCWSKKAIAEAARYSEVNIAASCSEQAGLTTIPPQSSWSLNQRAGYVHYTPNETIEGIAFDWVPNTGAVPLVADMTSMILSEPIDVSQYGIIYAGAQKNLGQSGITVVVVREDLVQEPFPFTPTLYTYQTHVASRSMHNTPPTYSWYMLGLVLEWIKSQGGVDSLYEVNRRKANKIYQCIDASQNFYESRIHPSCRSMMNVTFFLKNAMLTEQFLKESAEIGLVNLKGHRLVGGIRASIYNAMPEAGVDCLVDFMQDFINRYG